IGRQKAEQRKAGQALAASRFADQAQRASALDAERNAVDRAQAVHLDDEIVDLHRRTGHDWLAPENMDWTDAVHRISVPLVKAWAPPYGAHGTGQAGNSMLPGLRSR